MTRRAGTRFLTTSLSVVTRAWLVVDVVRIQTGSVPARLRVERMASSGMAARRERSSRERRREAGTVFTWAGLNRQTIR